MGKFYTAGKYFIDYIVNELGFQFHEVGKTDKKYYTHHETGNQIRVDYKNRLIALIDNKGYTLDESSSFTDNQIDKFLKGEL